MRNIQKRTLSLLVVIALLMSFIVPAVQIPASAATVTYKYSGSYIYNWGNRDEVATFLSPNAKAFYTGSNTYEQWAKLPGGATIAAVPNSALYSTLSAFMAGKQTHETSYKATNDLYQYTDCENNGSPSTISSFYAGKAVGPGWDSGSTWNKEHTWPNSKGDAAGNGEDDIMMLRPAASSTNSSRGNKAFGESTGYYDPDSLGQNVRGDAARVILYTYVRWKCTNTGSEYNPTGIFGTNGVIESKDILLKWMAEDPVDTWEMGRNDSVQSITGTRNVFVDYPQLAFQLFGEEVPANLTTPNGETYETAMPDPGATPPTTEPETPSNPGTAPSGTAYVKVTDAAQLTTGQYVLVVGQYAANVLDSGWVTVVEPTISGDYVTDAKGAVWTLTFDGSSVKLTDANGATIAPKAGNNNGIQSGDYNWAWALKNGTVTFNGVGSDTTTLAANTGSEYKIRAYKTTTVSGNANGYPNAFELYKLVDSEQPPVDPAPDPDPEPEQPPVTPDPEPETPSGETYTKVTDAAQLTTGQYVLVVGQYAANVLDSGWVTVVEPTISGDYVTDAKGAVWTLTFDGSSVKLTDANGATIAPKAGNNNGIQSGDYNWAWALKNGTVTFNGVGSDTTTLAANAGSEYKIRAYKTATVSGNANGYPNAFELYKLVDSEQPPVDPTPDPEPEDPTPDVPAVDYNTQLSRLPADGEYIVIVNSGKAMSKNASGKKLAAVTATVTDNVLTVTNDMACLKVVVEGDKYIFMLGDKYLTSGATGNGLSYADNLSDLSRWTMESAGNGAWYITNVGANYNGNYNQAMEYYSGFTTYGIKQQAAWQMQLFLIEAPEEGGEEPNPEVPADPDGTVLTIVEANAKGKEQAENAYTTTKYSVTGVVMMVEPSDYGNMYIQDNEGNRLYIYGTYDRTGAVQYGNMTERPDAGDTVTVQGVLGNYNGDPQMKNGWIMSFTSGDAPANPIVPPANSEVVTITFDSTEKQTNLAADQIVWEENGITVTADMDESTTAPNGAINPARFYKDYILTVEYENMKMVQFECGNLSYADALIESLNALSGIMVTRHLNLVAVSFTEPVDAFEVTLTGGQVRAYSLTVYTQSAASEPTEPINLKGVNVDFASSLTLNFNNTEEVLGQYEDLYVIFEVEGKEPVKVTDYTLSVDASGKTRYNFGYEGLTVMDLNVTVYATVHGTFNGREYVDQTRSYSLLKYVTKAITTPTADAVPCANLLKYAIAAEAFKEVTAEKRLENILTDDQKAAMEYYAYPDSAANVEKTSSYSNGTRIKFSGQSVEMASRITLIYKMRVEDSTLDISKLSFKVTYMDSLGNPAEKTYGIGDLVETSKDNYELYFAEFHATQLRAKAKCTIYIDGVEEGYYENSVENYCRVVENGNNVPEMKYLAKRISLYGDACAATYGK